MTTTLNQQSIILGIETCTNVCSAALWNGEHYREILIKEPRSHSKSLLPIIAQLLQENNLNMTDIEAIACSRGPGSFTGVRIGIGVAKGLAYGQSIPIISISPLAAIAYQVMQKYDYKTVCAILDARMGELYTGYYNNNQGVPSLITAESLTTISHLDGNIDVYSGTGIEEYHNELIENNFPLCDIIYPTAQAILALARQDLTNTLSASEFRPIYLRNKVTD